MWNNVWKLSDFRKLSTIDEDENRSIHKVQVIQSKQEIYILKEINVPNNSVNLNEWRILESTNHPNIIKCFGHFWEGKGCKRRLYVVLEYAEGGDLYDFIRNRLKARDTSFYQNDQRLLSVQEVYRICLDLSDGLKYLHDKRIIHRDIKSMNIFLKRKRDSFPTHGSNNPHYSGDTDWNVCIGDFGVSRFFPIKSSKLMSFCGTPMYTSPEMIEQKPYDYKTDIWSLGVLFYEIASGDVPFKGDTFVEIWKSMNEKEIPKLPTIYSSSFMQLVYEMIYLDPERRPTITAVFVAMKNIIGESDSLDQESNAMHNTPSRINEKKDFLSSNYSEKKLHPPRIHDTSGELKPKIANSCSEDESQLTERDRRWIQRKRDMDIKNKQTGINEDGSRRNEELKSKQNNDVVMLPRKIANNACNKEGPQLNKSINQYKTQGRKYSIISGEWN